MNDKEIDILIAMLRAGYDKRDGYDHYPLTEEEVVVITTALEYYKQDNKAF